MIHACTLEVLERLDVTARLRAEGHIVPRFTLRDRDRILATVRFDGLPTAYAHTLMIPQQCTERILLDRLRELGGDVHRPYSLTGLAEHPSVTDVQQLLDSRGPVSGVTIREIVWSSRFRVDHRLADRYRLGRVHQSRLDQCESARRPIARHVVAITDRMTRMATLRNAPARAIRNALISAAG